MNELFLTLELSPGLAGICAKAVGMEALKDENSRSEVGISPEGNLLKIVVRARDLSAMRAAMNTYLRWINLCLVVLNNNSRLNQ
jgi:tRNA threonylcarbamoyladenosine modification (KEOPS) complex  Pcc1 subunit